MRLFLLLFTLFLLFSCNELKKENTGGTDEVLDDFSKMSDATIQKGFSILDTIQLKPVDELVKELKRIPELQEIGVGDELLSFRLTNGPTMLIRLKQFSNLNRGGITNTKLPPLIMLNTTLEEKDNSDVLGAQRGEKREQKKALIIAPYAWHFGKSDDPLVPLAKLKDHRNYKGGITYKANNKKAEQNISLDDYLSFDGYDVIHFGTHGAQICSLGGEVIETSSNCHSYITSGINYTVKERPKILKTLKTKNIRGVALTTDELFFIPEFFTYNYPKITNKLLIISACQLGQRGDMEQNFNTILQNSQLFYWQNTIDANDATKAFTSLYDRMLDYGETAPVAFENMPDALKKNIPYFKDIEEQADSVEVFNYLKMASQGHAMHLIEPVTFIDEKTHRPLDEGQVFPFEGIFEDDLPESADFTLELLGYDQNEMQQGNMTLTLKVDGETVLEKQPFLPDSDPYDNIEVQNGKNEKTTWVTFKGIDLRKDLKKNSSVKLEALFHFDEEHYGYQSLQLSTGNSDMRIEMEHEGDHITMYFDADNYGLKMVVPKENQTMYGDEQGFMYVHSDEEGWIKTEMKGMFAAIGSKVPINLDFLKDLPVKGTFLHKIPAFAATLTIAKLEQEPRAKKISGPVDAKTIFMADGHVKITFDSKKRLESIEDKGYIKYYYEPQTVTFPKAKLFQMPSF